MWVCFQVFDPIALVFSANTFAEYTTTWYLSSLFQDKYNSNNARVVLVIIVMNWLRVSNPPQQPHITVVTLLALC